jgi:hypothetical protein
MVEVESIFATVVGYCGRGLDKLWVDAKTGYGCR